jgi:hypothetical protein
MGGVMSCLSRAIFSHRKLDQMQQLENVLSDDDDQRCTKNTKKTMRTVEIIWHGHAKTAQISGDFNRWLVTDMRCVADNEFRIDVVAKVGSGYVV